MTIDKHTLALISIIGGFLDMIGALYLAYDLLGGEHGPLRTLTRAVTYGILFGVGFGLFFGPVVGLACGATTGFTIALELSRAAKHKPKPGFWVDTAMSAIRGAGFALGTGYLYGVAFGVTFGVLNTVGQVFAYQRGIRPTMDYQPAVRLRVTRNQLLAAANRMVGYVANGFISALVAHQSWHALSLGLKTGLAIGVVTVIFGACTPAVEWGADHVPAKSMGVFGVALILIGFTLQSFQYWVALLDIKIRSQALLSICSGLVNG
jgi:hypothetical protein